MNLNSYDLIGARLRRHLAANREFLDAASVLDYTVVLLLGSWDVLGARAQRKHKNHQESTRRVRHVWLSGFQNGWVEKGNRFKRYHEIPRTKVPVQLCALKVHYPEHATVPGTRIRTATSFKPFTSIHIHSPHFTCISFAFHMHQSNVCPTASASYLFHDHFPHVPIYKFINTWFIFCPNAVHMMSFMSLDLESTRGCGANAAVGARAAGGAARNFQYDKT